MLLPSNRNPPALQEALARALGALPQDAFELAVGLVMAHHPGLQPYDDFGFDLDALDALTLRQMQVGGGICMPGMRWAACDVGCSSCVAAER